MTSLNLYKHQQDLVDKFPRRHALIWGTGSGKSLAAIELSRKTRRDTLIIVPKSLKRKWEEDLKFYKFGATILTKEEFKKLSPNLEEYPCVVVDEAHYFFSQKSQMMKSLKAYFKKWDTPYRYLLSATPYRSSPMDIFIMSNLLGKPMSYPVFFDRFFYKIRMGRREIPVVRAGIEPEIAKLVKALGSTVKLEDCVDVPEQTFEVEYFDLTPEQKAAMKNVPDVLPIVRFTKYHQICGGTLKGDEYTESQSFMAHKKDRLLELVQSNDRVIVVCRYNYEIKVLQDLLRVYSNHDISVINGEVAGGERHKILEKFNKTNKYVLLVNAACSEGWELPECPLMVFYSLDFSLKNYIQILGRVLRINKLKKNVYVHLVVKGTIDEEVYKSMMKKEDFHIQIYNA